MNEGLTAVVLAGGRSARFGAPKALAPWAGGTLVESVIRSLSWAAAEVLVVVKDPGPYRFLVRPGVRLVEDRYGELHAAGGVFSGLEKASTSHAFVCACDMPLIAPETLRGLWALRDQAPAVVPVWQGLPQPLCALYAAAFAPELGRLIDAGELGLCDGLETAGALFVDGAEVDPTGLSFLDLDTREEYEQVRRLVRC